MLQNEIKIKTKHSFWWWDQKSFHILASFQLSRLWSGFCLLVNNSFMVRLLRQYIKLITMMMWFAVLQIKYEKYISFYIVFINVVPNKYLNRIIRKTDSEKVIEWSMNEKSLPSVKYPRIGAETSYINDRGLWYKFVQQYEENLIWKILFKKNTNSHSENLFSDWLLYRLSLLNRYI